jgi:hypothetical protein
VDRGVSRRTALRAFAATAGGLGLTTVAGVSAASAAPRTESGSESFTLHGVGLRASAERRAQTVGAHLLIHGDVTRKVGGAVDGEFFAQVTVTSRRDLLAPSTGSVQTQTFVLSDGTLVGTGALSHDGRGVFAVTGGTGAYHGARGSYTVSQGADAFHGGVATYSFTLTDRKATSHGR